MLSIKKVLVLSTSLLMSIAVFGQQGSHSGVQSSPPLRAAEKKDRTISRLERVVPQLMKEADIAGLSMALVRDGKLVWRRGFGVKNSATAEPVTDSTVFEAASLSKPVFAYAVLKLVDQGRFDLDVPLNRYLPGNYDVGEDPRLSQITARRVLSHTAGFPNWRPSGGNLKIHFTPGEKFSYSGEGFVYLSKVIEHVTGEKFNDWMEKTVFVPLGMTSSSYVWRSDYDKQKTSRHNRIGEPSEQRKITEANAAASLQTTAEDFGRFMVAILNGTGLKRSTLRQMLTPQIKVDEGGSNTTTRPADKLSPYISWGLGWGLQTTADGLAFWHWGDNGDSKAYIVAYEKQRLGLVVFANSANGLSIIPEILGEAVGGQQPALAWLDYESSKSPARKLLKNILARGAEKALTDYCEWRKGRPAAEQISEGRMNQLGYDLLYGMKKVSEAIEVFKQNVEDHPQSFNVWDSLGEAYMVRGDKELAIRNYQRSLELNPDNKNGGEMLKKLRESQKD